MKKVAIALFLLAVLNDGVEACSRCRRFGSSCVYYRAPVKYVAPVIQAYPPQSILVVNNYPQPIAQQGASIYGLQSAVTAYAVNPAQILQQAAELSKAATATASLGISGYGQIAQTQLQLQASITETLSRGQAAAQVLGAAGLTPPAAQHQSFVLRVYRDASGAWQVEQAKPTNHPVDRPPEELPAERPTNSILAQKCARCHGLSLAEPKGEVYLDAGHRLSCESAMQALWLVREDKMPKGGPPLTTQEKGLLMDELLELTK